MTKARPTIAMAVNQLKKIPLLSSSDSSTKPKSSVLTPEMIYIIRIATGMTLF